MTSMAMDSGPPIGAGYQWVGKIFLLGALSWFGLVFYLQRPDLPQMERKPTPIVTWTDGKTYKVYRPSEVLGSEASWVEAIASDKNWKGSEIKTQYTYWDFMRRPVVKFLVTAMGPIFAAIAGAFIWLGIAEWRVRRRYPSNYDSLF